MNVNEVKKLVCALSMMFFMCIGIKAQSYFLESSDVVFEYVRTNVKDGSFVWNHTIRVIDMSDIGSYRQYTSESVFTKQNGKPLYKSAVMETTRVNKNTYDVSLNVGGAVASYFTARTGISASSSIVYSALPALMEPGDTLPDVYTQIKVGPLTYSVHVFNRMVLRRETITVPAGTFECVVVSENRIEKGPGHNRTLNNLTWYSKNVGYVRHDTYIKGVLDTSEILSSVKNLKITIFNINQMGNKA